MTTREPCPSCIERKREPPVMVPPNHICFDCYCPTAQERQHESERLRHIADSMMETRADRFALAALTGIRANSQNLGLSSREALDWALEHGDDAAKRRFPAKEKP